MNKTVKLVINNVSNTNVDLLVTLLHGMVGKVMDEGVVDVVDYDIEVEIPLDKLMEEVDEVYESVEGKEVGKRLNEILERIDDREENEEDIKELEYILEEIHREWIR